MTSEERAKIITDYLKGRAEWLQKQSYHNIKDDLIDQAFELSEEKSMRGEIENMLKEFIPLSANYCVEDLTSAILEAIKKRVPKKRELGESGDEHIRRGSSKKSKGEVMGRKLGTKNKFKISKGAFPSKKCMTGVVFSKDRVQRELEGR
jgi:hypothetical protein